MIIHTILLYDQVAVAGGSVMKFLVSVYLDSKIVLPSDCLTVISLGSAGTAYAEICIVAAISKAAAAFNIDFFISDTVY